MIPAAEQPGAHNIPDQLIEQCIERLSPAFEINFALAGSMPAHVSGALRIAVVAERVELLSRRRWTTGSTCFDCVIGSFASYSREILRGTQHHLIRQLANGQPIFGKTEDAIKLQILARERLRNDPPVTKQMLDAMMNKVHDLMLDVSLELQSGTSMIDFVAAYFVQAFSDCYFAANSLWAVPVGSVLSEIRRTNPDVADLLHSFLQQSSSASVRREGLDNLVARLRSDIAKAYSRLDEGKRITVVRDERKDAARDSRLAEALRSYRVVSSSEAPVSSTLLNA